MQHKNKKYKAKSQKSAGPHDLLYGPHAIIECLKLKKRKLRSIYTTKPLPKSWKRVESYLPSRIPNIQYVDRDILARMAGTTDHGGIIALVSHFRYAKALFNPKTKPFILVLDDLQDVRNLGAILRSAYCLGVDGVVLCKMGAAPLTPTVFKTSAGLAEHLNIFVVSNLKATVFQLKRSGYNLYMAVVSKEANAIGMSYKKPLALVIGNEATGIPRDVQELGQAVTLPQTRPDISYNASVAAGILLFLAAHLSHK